MNMSKKNRGLYETIQTFIKLYIIKQIIYIFINYEIKRY